MVGTPGFEPGVRGRKEPGRGKFGANRRKKESGGSPNSLILLVAGEGFSAGRTRRCLLPWVCLWWPARTFSDLKRSKVQIRSCLPITATPRVFSRRLKSLVAGEGFSAGRTQRCLLPWVCLWWPARTFAGLKRSKVQIRSCLPITPTPRASSRRLKSLVAGEGFEPSTFGL